MAKVWDISQVLRPELPVWPGEPEFALRRLATIGDGCPVNVSKIETPTHAGTHADSPFHYDAHGTAMADCDLSPYLGPCVVLDATRARGAVAPDDVDLDLVAGTERLLLRTFERFPADAWVSDFTAISSELIAVLAGSGARLIGTDAPSLDPQNSKDMAAHRQALAADMRILEGLVLDGVPPGRYELIALPLKIAGSDASPIRAILRELDT